MASFLAMTSPKEAEKIVGRGFFIFRVFFGFLGPFWVKNHVFLEISRKMAQKSEKTRKMKNPRPTIFLNSFWLVIAKKLGV